MTKTTGIYQIRNSVNGKVYIGSSCFIENRWSVHKKALREMRHHSPRLQRAWNKYGESSFFFELFEIVERDSLISREQWWLDRVRPADRDVGYNIGRVAGSPMGFVHGPEMRRKMSEAHRGKPKSEAHRAAISAALKGRRPTDNVIAASVAFHTGRKQSEAERACKSATMKAAWAAGKFANRRGGSL